MAKSQRLLDLIQILRQYRHPVTGAVLAEALGVSLRTLYRDIASLQQMGAGVDGEPGLGYVLRPGFLLPPLMLQEEEVDAIMLGAQWVAQQGDERLAAAARQAIAKISAILPTDLRDASDTPSLLLGPTPSVVQNGFDLPQIRQAIRQQRKLEIQYQDQTGTPSRRIIWPFVLGFFDQVRVVAAWCELRQSYRHFRADRIQDMTVLEQRYPRRRQTLIKEWRAIEGLPLQGPFYS